MASKNSYLEPFKFSKLASFAKRLWNKLDILKMYFWIYVRIPSVFLMISTNLQEANLRYILSILLIISIWTPSRWKVRFLLQISHLPLCESPQRSVHSWLLVALVSIENRVIRKKRSDDAIRWMHKLSKSQCLLLTKVLFYSFMNKNIY